jgi:hypothetical protein
MSNTIEMSEQRWLPISGKVYTWLMSIPLNRFEYTNERTFLIEFENSEHYSEFVLTWL